MTDLKNYIGVKWAVFDGSKIVPADHKRTGFCQIAQCYMTGLSTDQPEIAHAAHIVAIHNALLGVPNPVEFIGQARTDPTFLIVFKHDVREDAGLNGDKDRFCFDARSMEEAIGRVLMMYPGLSYNDVLDHMEV